MIEDSDGESATEIEDDETRPPDHVAPEESAEDIAARGCRTKSSRREGCKKNDIHLSKDTSMRIRVLGEKILATRVTTLALAAIKKRARRI